MKKLYINIFKIPYKINLGFINKSINEQFINWQYAQSLKQIQYILILTGLLYILIGISNVFLAPEYLKNTLLPYQLFLIPSYLFLIAYLSSKKEYFELSEKLLLSSPIIAAVCHAYIFSHMTTYSTYQVELYLMIFWVFTISGLQFPKALLAALIVFFIGEFYSYFAYKDQLIEYISHSIWMIVSLLFGATGGYLIHQSKKETFEKVLELQTLVTTDTLTGLHNRAKLDSILTQELERAKRYNFNIGILILDIDYFKSINDTHGHLVGDEVLIEVSNTLKQNIRSSDYIFRWGGEEFIILCLEVNQDSLISFAEEIRLKIEEVEFDKVGKKTISIGASINTNDDTYSSILQRADQALYKSKKSGRNKVCFQSST